MELTNALWITLIGMGLVFVAILMLWGLMALLVRLTAGPEPAEAQAAEPVTAAAGSEAALPAAQSSERKRRAAAAAVAFALAARVERDGRAASVERETQSAGGLSPWQAVNRAGRIGLQVTSRKKVVR